MSGFDVTIVAGKDDASSSVMVTGSVQHVITDDERTSFHLGDSQLKQAVGKYFGKQPNDAFLHSPTSSVNVDLYEKYSWAQTETVLASTSAENLGITSQPVILKTQIFENNSSKEAEFDVSISDSVDNTSSSTWSTGGTLTVGQKLTYKISFLGTGGGGEISFSYSQSWGVGGTNSTSVTVGSTAGVKVNLKAGQSVKAILSASRGVMKVRVRYNAYLIGTTAVNYNPTYQGHYFWDFSTPAVMSSGGIPNSVASTEDIEIGYYSNGKIEIQDQETEEIIYTRFL